MKPEDTPPPRLGLPESAVSNNSTRFVLLMPVPYPVQPSGGRSLTTALTLYVYEQRTLRIVIRERLHPFKSPARVKDIGTTRLDIGWVYHWLYKYAGILHRDLGPNNIMCRFLEKNARGEMERGVYGVPTDYDLSLLTATTNSRCKRTSQQRTGALPYMVHELLIETGPLHLYRHDLESLPYIIY